MLIRIKIWKLNRFSQTKFISEAYFILNTFVRVKMSRNFAVNKFNLYTWSNITLNEMQWFYITCAPDQKFQQFRWFKFWIHFLNLFTRKQENPSNYLKKATRYCENKFNFKKLTIFQFQHECEKNYLSISCLTFLMLKLSKKSIIRKIMNSNLSSKFWRTRLEHDKRKWSKTSNT